VRGFRSSRNATARLTVSTRALRVFNGIAHAAFRQPAESIPVMEDADYCAFALSTQDPENCPKNTSSALLLYWVSGGRPFIERDAMLLGVGSHDDQCPVGASGRRHHASRVVCRRPLLAQLVDVRYTRFVKAGRAQAVDADDDNMLSARGLDREGQ
jgi:hypothetical protein